MISNDLAEGLANCAREPVHIPGAIQPAGCLVCVDNALQQVLSVSANIAEILGVTPTEAFGQSPSQLLGPDLLEQLASRLELDDSLPLTLECQYQTDTFEGGLQATVYQSDTRWVFEFEPIVSVPEQHSLALLNRWIKVLGRTQSVERLLFRLIEAVESLTGYGRIMVYQFDEEWHGTVISEKRHDALESFLGHRFPAKDI